ncbi:hypothetical protein [Jannaschia sp. W003]|uniref:hypothetical protein n=1 Tax=Jannaschia sp. W003 TaxID=2867012 RepID=UPI0021A27E4C|nr:hypothetical protein [Jannaschia sp. W003]UWQ23119.1 hypothetical protein K3554_16200 [Jannaschia sp. W003]
MKRKIGYDLGGWHDVAVLREDGAVRTVSGGSGAAVVDTDPAADGPRAREEAFVGGVQGMLAPHGRGPGWGTTVGASHRRVPVREVVAPDAHASATDDGARFRAALRGLADPRRATVALAIPDDGSLDEAARDWRLAALRRAGARSALLVWRPVALVLDALARGTVREGTTVATLSHGGEGLSVQTLEITTEDGVAAPLRKEAGRAVPWSGGLAVRRAAAIERLARADPRGGALAETMALPVAAALGEATGPELVRQGGGGWTVVEPVEAPALPDLPGDVRSALAGATTVLVDTPLAGGARARLLELLGAGGADPDPDAVARGAAEAARRFALDLPVFFDFLPQISTVVAGAREAENFDLIPEGARLRAGRLYRSEVPARMRLLRGATRVDLYLRRQSDARPRRAEVPLPGEIRSDVEIAVSVEQMPAAGRARVILESPGLIRPLLAHWEEAEELEESWDEVIANASNPPPSIPARMVLPCSSVAWRGRDGESGLEELLREYRGGHAPGWKEARTRMAIVVDGHRTISSDGALPEDLDPTIRKAFETLSQEAAAAVERRLDGRDRVRSNDALLFLTWQFRRCPQDLVPELIRALRTGSGRHPFHWTGANAAGLWQGIGRCATEEADHRAAFDLLLACADDDWKKNHLACAAFLLSRTDAATLLGEGEVARIGHLVAARMEALTRDGDFGARFMYLPFLFVGLLRCRLADPWALVAGQDRTADRLLAAAEAARRAMEGPDGMADRRRLLAESCDELRGEGRNPNLLAALAGEAK